MANPAKPLISKLWGSNWIDSIPVGWRDSLKVKTTRTPGVPNTTDPDAITGDIVTSKVETNRTNELEKETTELEAVLSDKIWHEQDYEESFDVVIPKQRYLTVDNAQVGMSRRNIRNFNHKTSEVELFDITEIRAVLEAYSLVYDSYINIDLPDMLVSVNGIIEHAEGVGLSEEHGTFAASGFHSQSLDLHAQAQASANLAPDAFPDYKQFWGNTIKCTHYHFFLENPVTNTEILTKLAALGASGIINWPVFSPRAVNIKCKGGRASLQVNASSHGTSQVVDSGTSSTTGAGTGFSIEQGLVLRVVRVPPTIHGLITLAGDTADSKALIVSAEAHAGTLGPDTIITEGDASNPAVVATVTIASGAAATAGATAWPSGDQKYLYHIDPSIFKYGFVNFHCVVVNSLNFPS